MEDLIKMIDDITVKPYIVSTRGGSNLYPTSASVQYEEDGETVVVGSCLRKLWYGINEYPVISDNTAESIDRMNIGEWFSDNLIERFKQLGIYVAHEVPFKDQETGVSGRVDIFIKDPFKAPKPPERPQPNQLIGVEVKSTGGYHNIKGPIISTKDTPLMPKLEHVLQVMMYLGYYQTFGMDRWILIYQDRESLQKQWHKVTLNEHGAPVIVNKQQSVTLHKITLQGIKDRFNLLKQYVSSKTLPPRDYVLQYSNAYLISLAKAGKISKTDTETIEKKLKKYVGKDVPDSPPLLTKGDNECIYCPHKELCWSEDPYRKALTAVLKPIEKEIEIPMEIEDLI